MKIIYSQDALTFSGTLTARDRLVLYRAIEHIAEATVVSNPLQVGNCLIHFEINAINTVLTIIEIVPFKGFTP